MSKIMVTTNVAVIGATLAILIFTKIPPPYLILVGLIAGVLF